MNISINRMDKSHVKQFRNSLISYDWSADISQAEWVAIAATLHKDTDARYAIFVADENQEKPRKISYDTLLSELGQKTFGSIEIKSFDTATSDDLWRSCAVLLLDRKLNMKTMVFSTLSNNKFIEFDCFINKIIHNIDEISGFGYGIAYSSDILYDPIYYAMGIVQGFPFTPNERLKAKEISYWKYERISTENNKASFRHLNGYFRDIYPVNLIQNTHLESEFEGIKLKDLIGTNPIFGTLEKINSGWLWKLDSHAIEAIRKMAIKSNILIQVAE